MSDRTQHPVCNSRSFGLLLALLLLVAVSGCSFSSGLEDCDSDADCNSNEECNMEAGVCVRLENLLEQCGDRRCVFGEICCNEECVDTNSDNNCGACGNVCGPSSTCDDRVCECAIGFKNCDGDFANGCEVDTGSDDNCGDCGVVCGEGSECVGGICACEVGFFDCSVPVGDACDVDIDSDPDNCGGCNNICDSSKICDFGDCFCGSEESPVSCSTSQECCGTRGASSCISVESSLLNCGECGNDCRAGEACVDGSCSCNGGAACAEGEACCGGSCQPENSPACMCGNETCVAGEACCNNTCTPILADDNNCGDCGEVCPAGSSCVGGTCQCQQGQDLCEDQCVNVSSDPLNCGGCGNQCQSGDCCNGMCVDTDADLNNCGMCGVRCSAGESCCDGDCIDTTSNIDNCGTCGNACGSLPGALSTTCSNGICLVNECEEGRGDCDGDSGNGCEFDISANDNNNCGSCGNTCISAASCFGGVCKCGNNKDQCDTTIRINADLSCTGSNCSFSCLSGFNDCNGSGGDGCETQGPCP